MRLLIAAILAVSTLLLLPSTSASARTSGDVLFDRHNINQHYYIPTYSKPHRRLIRIARHKGKHLATARGRSAKYVAHPAGCPRSSFCGCGVARHLGIKDRSLWLAASWLRFPRAAAAPGMVAARRGHVFAILQVIRPGLVLAYDPNSGNHRTRIHERRLAGFTVVNPRRRRA